MEYFRGVITVNSDEQALKQASLKQHFPRLLIFYKLFICIKRINNVYFKNLKAFEKLNAYK